jgi:hypothetical protein
MDNTGTESESTGWEMETDTARVIADLHPTKCCDSLSRSKGPTTGPDLIQEKCNFHPYTCYTRSKDSSVGIATGYGLNDLGSIPGSERYFFPPQHPHRFWGPLTFLSDGYWGCFPGDKAAGPLSWPLTSISCRGKRSWSYTSTPLYVFMA